MELVGIIWERHNEIVIHVKIKKQIEMQIQKKLQSVIQGKKS